MITHSSTESWDAVSYQFCIIYMQYLQLEPLWAGSLLYSKFSENVTPSCTHMLSPRVLWGLSDLSVERARNHSSLWIFTKSPNTTSRIWKVLRRERKMKKQKPLPWSGNVFWSLSGRNCEDNRKILLQQQQHLVLQLHALCCPKKQVPSLPVFYKRVLWGERGNSMLWLLKELLWFLWLHTECSSLCDHKVSSTPDLMQEP